MSANATESNVTETNATEANAAAPAAPALLPGRAAAPWAATGTAP